MNQSFFIVVNARTGPSRHPYKHATFPDAQREAERIAALSPGDKVFVLQAVGFAAAALLVREKRPPVSDVAKLFRLRKACFKCSEAQGQLRVASKHALELVLRHPHGDELIKR